MPAILLPIAVAAAAQLAGAAPLAFHGEVTVQDRIVRLDQVADLSALPAALRARAGAIEVATLSPGQSVTVDAQRLAGRARARLPALSPWMPVATPGRVVLRRPAAPKRPAASGQCARLETFVPAGAFLLAADLTAADCGQGFVSRSVRLDVASGAVRARRDLAAGEIISAPPPAGLARARPGEIVRLTTIVGPVAVDREVVLSRPAKAGSALFVKGSSGPVFTAPPPVEAKP